MTPLHQRPFTIGTEHSDAGHLAFLASVKPGRGTDIHLPMGGSHFQGLSNRCAAAAVWNALDSCGRWLSGPLPSPEIIYAEARKLAGARKWDKGTFLHCAAEAACRLLDGKANWMVLPNDPHILANWIAVEQTALAYATDWTAGHMRPRFGHNDILFPTGEQVAEGHAACLNAIEFARPCGTGFLWLRKKPVLVFGLENTHRFSERRFFIQVAEVPVHGRFAVAFIPPSS